MQDIIYHSYVHTFLQISLGRRRQQSVVTASTTTIESGQWVAVYCEDGEDPSIGKVKEVKDHEVVVIWYKGKWNSSWKEWMVPCSAKGNKKMVWESTVPKDSLILFAFEMTPTCRLQKETVTYLKRRYEELRQ